MPISRSTLFHVCVLLLMLGAVTTLFVLTQSYDRETHHRRLLAMQELKRWEALLHQDLLRTRAEFLPHYEGLIEAKDSLVATYGMLVQGPYKMVKLGSQELDDLLSAYGHLLDDKVEMLSRFQASNSILHNSVRYFPSGVKGLVDLVPDHVVRQSVERDAGRVLQSMLLYIQRSTGERQHQVSINLEILQQWKDRLSQDGQEDLDTLVSHAQTIIQSTKSLDSLIPEILQMPTNEVLDQISRIYSALQAELDSGAEFYRMALYLLSVLFVLYIGVMLLQLKKASVALAKSKEGLERQVALRTAELSDANAELQLQIGERHQAQNAEAQAREVAERASRAKSDFLANMSHEFRTPLNGILGYTQILKRDSRLLENQQKGVKVIHDSGEHLLTLVNDILDLSKIEAQKMDVHSRIFYLPEFLDAIVNLTKVRAEQKGLTFFYLPSQELPLWIQGDTKRLRQVLLNLLSNAIKFTEQGSVTFRVDMEGEVGDRRQLRFEVEDTGIGIDPEKLEAIFLPFQQVVNSHTQTEGTGLGLTICQRLVKCMGGKLHVASIVQKGSRFWVLVDLPEATEPEEKKGHDGRSVVAYTGDIRHILIVDDNVANRSFLSDLLQPLGFIITEASTGKEAIAQAEKILPDIMLVDLLMPEKDGMEVAQAIRGSSSVSSMVMIALSANVFENTQHKCFEAGFNDFLPKPVQVSDLLRALKRHLNVEWVYQSERVDEAMAEISATPMVFPPILRLESLLTIAKQGNIKAIREHIEGLNQTDQSLRPFVAELRRLADGFLIKQLCDFLSNSIERKRNQESHA